MFAPNLALLPGSVRPSPKLPIVYEQLSCAVQLMIEELDGVLPHWLCVVRLRAYAGTFSAVFPTAPSNAVLVKEATVMQVGRKRLGEITFAKVRAVCAYLRSALLSFCLVLLSRIGFLFTG